MLEFPIINDDIDLDIDKFDCMTTFNKYFPKDNYKF